MAGFVVLSTFVPTVNACNMVLGLVHLTLFLFLTSELLIHLDFYSAIVLPFWHEESIGKIQQNCKQTADIMLPYIFSLQ